MRRPPQAADNNAPESGMNGDAGIQRDGEMDLRMLWQGIVARKHWIIVPTLLLLAATFVFVNVVKPRYTAEAKIFLDNQESYYTRPAAERGADVAIDAEAVQSQVQLVLSRDLARQAIAELGLAGNAEFDPLAGGLGPAQRLMVLLGFKRDPTTISPEERIFESYYEKLKAFQVPRTRVLAVEFTSYDPELAERAANTVARLYINLRANAKTDTARQASEWLSTTIDELRTRVTDAEARVETFRAKSGLLVGANNTTITAQQLAELNTQLASARSAQSEAQAKARIIREMLRAGRSNEIPDVARDDLIRRIEEQRVNLRGQLAMESRTLLPAHPRIKELQAQIADIDRELRLAAEKSARALENESRLAGARVDNLTATLDQQKKTVATGNGDEVQLRALEREAKVARDQLESYLARYREATAREGANASPADARIISRAVEPQFPSFPKKIPMLAIAGLAGFLLSASLVVTRELFTGYQMNPLRAAPDMETIDLADSLPVPARKGAAPDIEPSARQAGTMAALLGELAQLPREEECGARIAIAAPLRGCGASATAIALARGLSQRGRTILVDLDWQEPALDELVMPPAQAEEEEAPMGLSDLLSGEAGFAEVIHRDRGSRLHVLPAGRGIERGEGLDEVLEALEATYEFVVLDCAAAVAADTIFTIAAGCDAIVLVSGEEMGEALDAAREELEQAGAARIVHYLPPPGEAEETRDAA